MAIHTFCAADCAVVALTIAPVKAGRQKEVREHFRCSVGLGAAWEKRFGVVYFSKFDFSSNVMNQSSDLPVLGAGSLFLCRCLTRRQG